MAAAMKCDRATGFTLLELLVVIAIMGILTCLATWGSTAMLQGRQVERAGHQLFEDLKQVQNRAEMSGNFTMSNGTLVMQRSFLVFDPAAQRYEAYQWRDHNSNGMTDDGEAERLWQKDLPPGVSFGWATGINRRACSNANTPPSSAISFASPEYLPCNNRPCLKFDQHGFSVIGPGAIYLHEGEQSLAITGTRPGHFTICAWNGVRWK